MLDRRAFILAAASQAVAAQTIYPRPDPEDVAARALYQSQALYLPEREFLARSIAGAPNRDLYRDLYAQWLASTGDDLGAWREGRIYEDRGIAANSSELVEFRFEDGLQAVARLARDRRVVILNDAHDGSRTRAFAHAVALTLEDQGFKTFAAETFTNPAKPSLTAFSVRNGPVTSDLGYYTGDPVYASLLRDLRDRRWRFASYEQRPDQVLPPGDSGVAREEDQAKNLAEILTRNPSFKVLIYCGEGHGYKRYPGSPRMGAKLVLRGFNPLVIDQTILLSGPNPKPGSLTGGLQKPSAVWLGDGRPYGSQVPEFAGASDISIAHPPLRMIGDRPSWLASSPSRARVVAELPADLPKGTLVQAVPWAEAETANVVPADQFPLSVGGERKALLFLKPGSYELRAETVEGRTRFSRLNCG